MATRAPSLLLPSKVDARAGGEAVTVPIRGEDLPPPSAVHVVTSEGEVLGVEEVPGGLDVQLRLSDAKAARVILVGVRDARGADRPVWTQVRVRARLRLSYLLEPRSTLQVEVGGRTYGPFAADEAGAVGRVGSAGDLEGDAFAGRYGQLVGIADDVELIVLVTTLLEKNYR